MKKVFSAFILALAVLSCSKPDDGVKPEVFNVLAELSDLPATAGTVNVQSFGVAGRTYMSTARGQSICPGGNLE